MNWSIGYYNERLQQEILELPARIQARYIHLTQRMLIHGPNLGMPHTRSLGQGLFELRMKSDEGLGRIFYCVCRGQQIMMLHTFLKKTQKTPTHERDIAKRRMKEVMTNAQP